MDEQALRTLIRQVTTGALSRRHFVRTLVGLGLTAPMAARILAAAGPAHAQPRTPVFTPTRRGGGGPLRVLWWQAPTLLNPHFATGTKDQDGSRLFYEPLAGYDPDGTLVPILAAQIPSVENGGLAKDGTWVVWTLKRGVTWHDGKPFTADDVVFNWEYAADPATAAVTHRHLPRPRAGREGRRPRRQDRVQAAHALLARRVRRQPRDDHSQAPLRGIRRREVARGARPTSHPVGTGPYRFVDFKPGDLARGELFSAYHVANRPFFDTIEMKGGGDAVSAARAVIQTGEYDFAWNIQVEDDILRRLEQGGKGRTDIVQGSSIEHIQLQLDRPVEGRRGRAGEHQDGPPAAVAIPP